ncbi:MAG: hypothetical protein BWK76_24090 [Desulfobulbaceae bacterium A2]|nr:MAG: hypothetical protein BWK76_24090 [Desulfobulbaceae bacterium A2]
MLEELAQLRAENEQLRRLEKRGQEVNALLKCARAVLHSTSFAETAREIFDVCRELIGATSGYVALLSPDGEENEVLFLEAGGLDCTVDQNLPMPIRGLRAVSYKLHKAVYDNRFMTSEWVGFMPAGHVVLENVLFAPLVNDNRAVGLLGIANKKGGFTDEDARMAAAFGELAAIALQNSRTLDKLQAALQNIKTLHGLLPICSSCKKIRDDKGYWNHLEVYIRDHSDADFTHSLCPDCITKLYPTLKLD